jgi:hypothetical protein
MSFRGPRDIYSISVMSLLCNGVLKVVGKVDIGVVSTIGAFSIEVCVESIDISFSASENA